VTDTLPSATQARWTPLRTGLVDLFHFDDEQFWFHDGRLLLRGNNGTGKSKVLALTLPFLLDGSMNPSRVEPDADPKKRMEWNLLLGGAHKNPERTGYTWIEFGRRDADGEPRYTTLGIGMKAAQGRGIVKRWFFVTTRRIGDLHLTDSSGTALGEAALREAIEPTGTGMVYTTAEAYRRAVDDTLFQLGEDRYAALVDILIQLRQPQLSKRPDEKALSHALTEALPPLDQAIISDVAESFRSLADDQRGLDETRETLEAARGFLRTYGTYAKVGTRRWTREVREADSAFRRVGTELGDVEAGLESASAALADIATALADVETQAVAADARRQALREGPEARQADELERAESRATDAERRADDTARDAQTAENHAARVRDEVTAASGDLAASRRRATTDRTTATQAAAQAGLVADHDTLLADEAASTSALERRRTQISHVADLLTQAKDADAAADAARTRLDQAEAARAQRVQEVAAREAEIGETAQRYRDVVAAYLATLTVLAVDGAGELPEVSEEWAHDLDGDSPLVQAVTHGARARDTELADARAAATAQATRLTADRHAAAQERDRLAAGHDPVPGPWPQRDTTVREGLDGAPLWQAIDFADHLDTAGRAGVEAALEASGLLDAWIRPDGTVTDVVAGDVVIGPSATTPPTTPPTTRSTSTPQRTLSEACVAAVGDTGLPADVVTGVLASIGFGADAGIDVWVAADGGWAAGPARGTAHKPAPEFVGSGARAAHRRRRIELLDAHIAELTSAIETATVQIATIDAERAQVRSAVDALPHAAERELTGCHARLAAAREEVARATELVAEARIDADWAVAEATRHRAVLDENAARFHLVATTEALTSARDAVGDYARALAVARRSLAEELAAQGREDAAVARSVIAEQQATERADRARADRLAAQAARTTADELRATVGASVAELERQLAEVTGEMERLGQSRADLAQRQLTATAERAALSERAASLGEQRAEQGERRARAVEDLRAFTTTGLVAVALPGIDHPDAATHDAWTMTAALAFARTAEASLEAVPDDDERWKAVRQRMSTAHTDLQSAMSRHGHEAYLDLAGMADVARVRFRGEDLPIEELAERLAADVAERERILTAREREVIENYLVGDVAGHLSELMVSAQTRIDAMNRELADRKTSTGMQLRVRWRERGDGPAGLAEARGLLVRADATWTAADREAIATFLQGRITEVREADPTGSWREHLDKALDYRAWHVFVVERRGLDATWRSASGPASGGERVLAASIPLFAAASSMYESAAPGAPRLILLDEAFAGVDDDSRAKSLGLLATFDLDVVMTSEREWGCYPQVPGLAISQLTRAEGIDAVGVIRWRWDGVRRVRDTEPDAGAFAMARGAAHDGGRWGDEVRAAHRVSATGGGEHDEDGIAAPYDTPSLFEESP